MRFFVITLTLALVACQPGAALAPTPADTGTPSPLATPTATQTQAVSEDTPEPEPTPTAEPTTATFLQGEKIGITCNDEDCLEITVSRAKVVPYYRGDYGYRETPDQKGYRFLQVYVTYKALKNGASYGSFDWQLFVGDREAKDTYVSYGPKPFLSSGDLPKGKSAAGWMFWEVPAKGRLTLSYGANTSANDAPIFEIVLRR
jgi:hypothetical protein